MKAWLRRARWSLLALVVLVPLALAVALEPRFWPYLTQQPQPDVVALGDTVRYGGAAITLTDLEVLDGAEVNAPAGADLVVATLSVDVVDPPESTYCDVTVVSAESGVERAWDAESFSDSDYRIPDRFATRCDLTEAGATDLQLTFLVPRGEVDDPVIQFSSSAALPRVLRLG